MLVHPPAYGSGQELDLVGASTVTLFGAGLASSLEFATLVG
jgi:hypothetical protein